MRSLLTIGLAAFLCSCSILSPETRSTVRAQVEGAYSDGAITKAQRDAAVEALDRDEPFDWTQLGIVGINIALALLGAPAVVRLQRGKPTQKVGLPSDKIHPVV